MKCSERFVKTLQTALAADPDLAVARLEQHQDAIVRESSAGLAFTEAQELLIRGELAQSATIHADQGVPGPGYQYCAHRIGG